MDILKELGISQIDLGDVSVEDSTLPYDWEWDDHEEEEVDNGRNESHNGKGN